MKIEADVNCWNSRWRGWHLGNTPTRLNIFRLFRDLNLPIDKTILDVGCGAGILANFWYKRGYNVLAVDFSEEAIKITSSKGIQCRWADAKELPFADNTFDFVYSDGLLEHFLKPELVLHEIWRVSRDYILTLVPRCTLYNLFHNLVFKPPKEYKRADNEWVEIHKNLSPAHINIRKVNFGILWILCQKGR